MVFGNSWDRSYKSSLYSPLFKTDGGIINQKLRKNESSKICGGATRQAVNTRTKKALVSQQCRDAK